MLPAAISFTLVETEPLSSLSMVQVEAPAHAEKATAGVAFNITLAPGTGVLPSAAITWTLNGFRARLPIGVAGPAPEINFNPSEAAAPNVTALEIVEDDPLAGSLNVTSLIPSRAGGVAVINRLALTASTAAVVDPKAQTVFR
ncbi:MAG: hypothetical protein DMG90_08140 [Acidobacteria bacterium]|nr:MAG: hypothetical protein DMG90_08140 [Acidobacteriota bacterium]